MNSKPVGGVDVGEPPARVLYPVADPLHLFAGKGRVDQDRIAFAEEVAQLVGGQRNLGLSSDSSQFVCHRIECAQRV